MGKDGWLTRFRYKNQAHVVDPTLTEPSIRSSYPDSRRLVSRSLELVNLNVRCLANKSCVTPAKNGIRLRSEHLQCETLRVKSVRAGLPTLVLHGPRTWTHSRVTLQP